jgi:hypothetical protein
MWHVFISHASEDRSAVAQPLARELQKRGIRVWFDQYELKLGDSLREKIDDGILRSHFGLIILSPNFFEKNWPRSELAGLFQIALERPNSLLPIWYKVTEKEVRTFSPILADRIAAKWSDGIDSVVQRLLQVFNESGIDVVDGPELVASSRFSAARLRSMKATILHGDDDGGNLSFQLREDRSIPASQILFELATRIDDVAPTYALFLNGSRSSPWLEKLFLHEDHRIALNTLRIITDDILGMDHGVELQLKIRIFQNLVDVGSWTKIYSHLSSAVATMSNRREREERETDLQALREFVQNLD